MEGKSYNFVRNFFKTALSNSKCERTTFMKGLEGDEFLAKIFRIDLLLKNKLGLLKHIL